MSPPRYPTEVEAARMRAREIAAFTPQDRMEMLFDLWDLEEALTAVSPDPERKRRRLLEEEVRARDAYLDLLRRRHAIS